MQFTETYTFHREDKENKPFISRYMVSVFAIFLISFAPAVFLSGLLIDYGRKYGISLQQTLIIAIIVSLIIFIFLLIRNHKYQTALSELEIKSKYIEIDCDHFKISRDLIVPENIFEVLKVFNFDLEKTLAKAADNGCEIISWKKVNKIISYEIIIKGDGENHMYLFKLERDNEPDLFINRGAFLSDHQKIWGVFSKINDKIELVKMDDVIKRSYLDLNLGP